MVRLSVLMGCALGACGPRSSAPPAPPFQIVGDSHKQVRQAAPPAASPVFDGHVLRLRGARGEVLGLQVLIDHRAPVTLDLGLPTDVATVERFTVGYLRVVEPSTSMCGGSTGKGEYPDLLAPTDAPITTADAAFFDVAIAPGAPPGVHAGTLTVGARAVPVELRVEPITIDLAAQTSVWAWYKAAQVARTHALPEDGPEAIALERRYVELFRRHGVHLMTDFAARASSYAARRDLLAEAPLGLVPVKVSTDPAQAAIDARLHLGELAGTGLTGFAWPIDEPRDDATRAKVRAIGEALRTVTDGERRLLLEVADAPSPAYGDQVDIYMHPTVFPAMRDAGRPGQRWWTYNGTWPRAGSSIIDGPGTSYRVLGWIQERYAVELWHIWEVLYFEDRYNKHLGNDVLTNPLTFDQRGMVADAPDWCNGDGLLAYPQVRPSLRLKALRRGLQDRALIRKLAGCGGDVAGLLRRVVPRALGDAADTGAASWSLSEAPFEVARGELLDALVARCPDRT